MRERAKTAPLSPGGEHNSPPLARGKAKTGPPSLGETGKKQSPVFREIGENNPPISRRDGKQSPFPWEIEKKKISLYLPREMGNEAYRPFPSVEIEKKKNFFSRSPQRSL